jgi:hypothetical protein
VLVAVVAIWALTVAVVAVVTWTVIDAAGHHVLDDSALPRAGATRHQHGQTHHRDGTGGRRTPAATPPDSHPGSRPDPVPGAGRPGRSPSAPAPTPGGTAAPPHHAEQFVHSTPHPTPSPAPTTSTPSPAVTSATWQGDAGTLTVTCEGRQIHLQGATPADGWRIEVEQEDDAVVVQLEREDPEGEVHVRATCVNGQPRFDVEGHRPSPLPDPDSGAQSGHHDRHG